MIRLSKFAATSETHATCGLARGFTLLEMVVALAVFSTMTLIAYRGLTGILEAEQALEVESDRLTRLTFAVSLIERDLRQALPRPVRDRLGDPEPALFGNPRVLALSRLGWSNPAELARASVERVEYAWDDGTLKRIGWPVLDRGPGVAPAIQELLSGLDSVRLRFLGRGDAWFEQWPPPGGDEDPAWPRAIELTLEGSDFGIVRRTLALVAAPAPIEIPGQFAGEPADG